MPLRGLLAAVELLSRRSGERLPRFVDTISSLPTESLLFAGFSMLGYSVTGGAAGC